MSYPNQSREGKDERRTRTLESPPAVASLYCLPPAAVAAEELPFSILSLSSSLSLVVDAAKRRFNWGSGSGWKSHEETACVSCQLLRGGRGSARQGHGSGLEKDAHAISRTLGLIVGVYGKRIWIWWIERGKKRGWVNPHDARKRIAPKESKVWAVLLLWLRWTIIAAMGYCWTGMSKVKNAAYAYTEHLATSHNCRRRT